MPVLQRTRSFRPWLLLGAVAVVIFRMRRRLRRYEIVERSMAPTLLPGDYVVAIHRETPPLLGDIVVVPHPHRPGFELVKRAIGLPGQTVTVAGGRVFVDGAPVPEPWAIGPTQPDGEWRLGYDVFVLGDQRPMSNADSRTLGPLPAIRAGWRVLVRYWPPDRIGLIGPGTRNPDDAADF